MVQGAQAASQESQPGDPDMSSMGSPTRLVSFRRVMAVEEDDLSSTSSSTASSYVSDDAEITRPDADETDIASQSASDGVLDPPQFMASLHAIQPIFTELFEIIIRKILEDETAVELSFHLRDFVSASGADHSTEETVQLLVRELPNFIRLTMEDFSSGLGTRNDYIVHERLHPQAPAPAATSNSSSAAPESEPPLLRRPSSYVVGVDDTKDIFKNRWDHTKDSSGFKSLKRESLESWRHSFGALLPVLQNGDSASLGDQASLDLFPLKQEEEPQLLQQFTDPCQPQETIALNGSIPPLWTTRPFLLLIMIFFTLSCIGYYLFSASETEANSWFAFLLKRM